MPQERKQNLGEMAGDMAIAIILVAPAYYRTNQIPQVPEICQIIKSDPKELLLSMKPV
jgi:hypothetical protein